MIDKRKKGSYYTPKIIADFLVDYLFEKLEGNIPVSILEPSAGDGSFVSVICNHPSLTNGRTQIIAVERELEELNKIQANNQYPFLDCIHADFLEYQVDNDQRFSLVLGNPPYIKKNYLEERQIALCEQIHKNASLSVHTIKNIWTAFLVRCIEFTDENGIMAFVLPAELLQVKYAAELRNLLTEQFARVEFFTFSELLFDDCKGQDTLILVCQRNSDERGLYYCNIKSASDLETRNFQLVQHIHVKESKWPNHSLSATDLELLDRLKQNLKTTNDYCSSKAGIVTAANNYFIIDKNTLEEFSLHKYAKPIIQRGLFVNGSVELGSEDFEELINQEKPAYLLVFNKGDRLLESNEKLNAYIARGELSKLNERFKMTKREVWYEVPNIGSPAEAFFFKRCDKYPKLIKNSANVLVTDSAYVMTMKDQYEIEDLIFSFYNSLTLSFAELNGRHYGGGVLELTPNEFKGLPIPFVKSGKENFKKYVEDFENKQSIKDVCLANDARILKSFDNLIDDDIIEKVFDIREKLYLDRIKK